MSFITKRERVFNEYDLLELPARNEGKLKTYASCTDARAWSHFGSDKTEHLVEIIKRNNNTCRPKYVPVEVIVTTLMTAKNAEVARLKRRIEESEQMIAAYDQLDLTCEQKCDIANAHAAIKAANRELDDLYLNLDMSNYTEGIDSEGFQTGKSSGDEPGRGDEWHSGKLAMESKCNQAALSCPCDASTNVTDPRIEELQETIISKDAKLSAMKNTIAVMENDVCEPYCIYAHIYTALEKIFGVLCQNDKYRLYLNLLTSGKDTRCLDIKGRILYKLKVLEKFSMALIAPCSQELSSEIVNENNSCACYRAEIVTHLETTLAVASSESKTLSVNNKRAKLVADIMEHDDMKEILSKESVSGNFVKEKTHDNFVFDDYNIESENLNRLKSLQVSYEELMSCHENLKHEKGGCKKYIELEEELLTLNNQLREYHSLWNEKEYYRKRSDDLDSLKEKYLVLSEETSNLETKLKAESEINFIKTDTIDELSNENIGLEKKLNEVTIALEKEKNVLQCKLKEMECKIMCQEQQIKTLSTQIDRLLEHDHVNDSHNDETLKSIVFMDEIEAQTDQIKNLKDALVCSEEEKQQLQEQFQIKLNLINDLRMEIEDWKRTCERTLARNDYLEQYSDSCRDEFQTLTETNKNLSQELEDKSTAISNLINLINGKSQDIKNVVNEIDLERNENRKLTKQFEEIRKSLESNVMVLENENKQVSESLHLARQESKELLQKVKDYDDIVHKKDDLSRSLQTQNKDYNELRQMFDSKIKQIKKLEHDLLTRDKEIYRLHEINECVINDINDLKVQKDQYKTSLELTKKESEILENKLGDFENLRNQLQTLRQSQEKIIAEKFELENELLDKGNKLDNAIQSIQFTKMENNELINKLKECGNLRDEVLNLKAAYHQFSEENQALHSELADKNKELIKYSNKIEIDNEQLMNMSQELQTVKEELRVKLNIYNDLLMERNKLQSGIANKTEENNQLLNTLDCKIEENRNLTELIQSLQLNDVIAKDNIAALQVEHLSTRSALDAIRKDSESLMDKLRNYEVLANEFNNLMRSHDQIKLEKDKLQNDYDKHLINFNKVQKENNELKNHADNLITHNEEIEKSLINARNELIGKSPQNITGADILKDIEDMKKEKIINHKKVRELLDTLEETEHIISDLREDVVAREDKIAILENHINSLEDEVRKLHKNLSVAVETGEEIKDSYHEIDQSLEAMEAHHSKATHNMKLELSKLQNENAKLEQQISVTKLKSDESFRDMHKYASRLIHLQHDREIIITDIKQLELDSVGDSALSPDNCNTEDVLLSIDRVRSYIHAKNSKSTSLEQTVLKVQTSSQILLSKADEAKRILKKEKQKIIHEKEEAVTARLSMEKQLSDLKEKLQQQTERDKGVITDLEAEILNQKLIIDKINKSTQDYISKLKQEMCDLQKLYQNSLIKVKELQENLENQFAEKSENLNIIDKISKDLEQKSREVDMLKNNLEDLQLRRNEKISQKLSKDLEQKSKDIDILQKNLDDLQLMREEKKLSQKDVGVESSQPDFQHTISTQTGKTPQYSPYKNRLEVLDNFMNETDKHGILDGDDKDINVVIVNNHEHNKVTELLPTQKPPSVNEVQILTANIEPTFNYVRSSYLQYKFSRLSPGRLEQYSISCLADKKDSNNGESMLSKYSFDELSYGSEKNQNPHLVDIFSRQTKHAESSRIGTIGGDPQSATKSISITDFGLTSDLFDPEINRENSNFNEFTSGNSTDKDLFVIYQDTEINPAGEDFYDKKRRQVNEHPDILIETMTVNKRKHDNEKYFKKQASPKPNAIQIQDEFYEAENKIMKPTLNIKLPRVEIDRPLLFTPSENDKTSVDSVKRNGTTSSVTHDVLFSQKEIDMSSINIQSASIANVREEHSNEETSNYDLSRIDANFLLIENKNGHKQQNQYEPKTTKQYGNFGLEYILDAVQREVDPENIITYNTIKALRKSLSDDAVSQGRDRSNFSSSKFCHSMSSTEKAFCRNLDRKYENEHNILKTDDTDDYEIQIQYLTIALQNIEQDYKKKIEAIKVQYDNNIKSIINEHNQGVKSIQNLHEETLRDTIKIHENEVENLRSMSIGAMRRAEKLERENISLKNKMRDYCDRLDKEPVKKSTSEINKRKSRCRGDTKTLTKTNIEAFNVKPKSRSHGPCTCSADINVSDTIRDIFQQVDVDQRKTAEHAYLKYIAKKIMSANVEALDSKELSFLHLKVCRTWKLKLGKDEALRKRIDSLENEVMSKQRHAQEHMADLDRKVAEERRRLQEVREAVCRTSPDKSRVGSPDSAGARHSLPRIPPPPPPPPPPPATAEKELACKCETQSPVDEVGKRKSAGDLLSALNAGPRVKRTKESNRAVLAKLDMEERRERKLYSDEPPTRLRRPHDRPPPRTHKK